jgi:hypothetical protein
MSTYLVAAFLAVWDWALAPPVGWVRSLSLEWQVELSIMLVLFLFRTPITENAFIGRELSGEWWSERKRRREWYYYASMEPETFHALVTALRGRADKQIRLAERLEGRGRTALASHTFRRAAWRRQVRAQALHTEADRLEALWRTIEKERENTADGPAARAKVIRLMRRLISMDDRAASSAFAELRRMANWFKWESLAPREMTPPQAEKLTKVLRLMVGTSSLDEARNAYRSAHRILQENGWSHYWEAA